MSFRQSGSHQDEKQLATTHSQQVGQLQSPVAPTMPVIPDFHSPATSQQRPTLFTSADQMGLRRQYDSTQPNFQGGMHDGALPQDFGTMGSIDPHSMPATLYQSSSFHRT